MRIPFIAGNWKMNMTHIQAVNFMQDLGYTYKNKNNCEVAVCPPATALRSVKTIIEGDNLDIKLGAQNMYYESSGAFTGEISPEMLKALDVEYVIIGHSERRQYFNETNEIVNKKVSSAFKIDLKPIMCIGESLDIRESGKAEEFVINQLMECLAGIGEENVNDLTIAYEPIWAIGTGKTATSEDANDMCRAIRNKTGELYTKRTSEILRILYGGSVKPSNISELMNMPDIDGALVGGASLKVDDFTAIINY
ncbi:MAG: triose-phosphate isomerase [Actinobacteria bacterium RBG_19FT_COMBO_36_27]|nr:MAG: triose-phosphate isomerase [Actinobacteria bacterium RBG_19FT_COMBO_36_27]